MDHSTMDMGMQHVTVAAGGFDYGLAFMAGVLGSGHCLGMCGALVSGYFMKAGAFKTLFALFYVSVGPDIRLYDGRFCGSSARLCAGFQRRVW